MGAKTKAVEAVVISAPRFQTTRFLIRGNAPYVQNAFSEKAQQILHENHEKGSVARKGKKKEPKDFHANYLGAIHRSREGWCGIPASAFRAAIISACRLVGFKMTLAKLSVFVEGDGFDAVAGTPLIRITKGEPEYIEHYVRVANGQPDLRARAMWREGWEAEVRVRHDLDQFTAQDVTNLMMRVGQQVGIGEGRPDSRMSAGQGWGTFDIVPATE